jgi:cysteine-rich repeat protein
VDTQKEKAICGNAKIEQNEQCDDGNTTNGDACSNTCQKETRYCGDGIVQRPNE